MQRNFLAGAKMQAAQKLCMCINNRYQLLLSCIAACRRLMKTCKQLTYENSLCIPDGFSSFQRNPYLMLCVWEVGGSCRIKI